MRHLLIGTAAAVLALGAAATPAHAQYGGSPDQQVEGTPAQPDQAAMPQAVDEGDAAADDSGAAWDSRRDPNDPIDADIAAEADAVAGGGKAGLEGEEFALADVDGDLDVDADLDTDMDADQGGAIADEPGEIAPGEGYEDEVASDAQGEDGRAYCRRSDGTTGLVVGGGAGALVGREIGRDGRHYRRRGRGGGTTGAILGGLIGAVVGSAIERSASEQNCR